MGVQAVAYIASLGSHLTLYHSFVVSTSTPLRSDAPLEAFSGVVDGRDFGSWACGHPYEGSHLNVGYNGRSSYGCRVQQERGRYAELGQRVDEFIVQSEKRKNTMTIAANGDGIRGRTDMLVFGKRRGGSLSGSIEWSHYVDEVAYCHRGTIAAFDFALLTERHTYVPLLRNGPGNGAALDRLFTPIGCGCHLQKV